MDATGGSGCRNRSPTAQRDTPKVACMVGNSVAYRNGYLLKWDVLSQKVTVGGCPICWLD